MRTNAAVIGALAAIALAATAISFRSESKPYYDYPRAGTNVIAFGDSIIAGAGSTGVAGASSSGGFVTLLSDRLGVEILNFGRRGASTGEALKNLDTFVLSKDPKIVILHVTWNDILNHVSPETIYANLTEIMGRIHATGAGVLFLGIPANVFGEEYKELHDRIAAETEVSYVPELMGGISGNPEFLSDGAHPNDAGYEIIADRVEPVLRELLAGRR